MWWKKTAFGLSFFFRHRVETMPLWRLMDFWISGISAWF